MRTGTVALLGHLRGAVTPCSGDDLEAVLGERPHKQGRENALGADALGQFLQGRFLEDAARVGLRFIQRESETLRYSVALMTWVSMMVCSFRAVEG